MCGIVGAIAKQGEMLPVSAQDMATALGMLRHRGPDAQNLAALYPNGEIRSQRLADWWDGQPLDGPPTGYLGHARLKIVDLSDAANQPFRYSAPNGKTYWIIHNGEIYNHPLLKQRLLSCGYSFETQCDTEILPAMYDHMGPAMVNELNGMFAFAIWDAGARQLFMARDRYGMKPLYTARLQNGGLAFASEMKSLLSLPGISKAVNSQALYEHFTFQFCLSEQTFIKAISHFPKGHYAVWDGETGQYRQARYWEAVFRTDETRSESDWVESVDGLLSRAVASQRLGDVPVGSFLSGGIDTGAIAAIASGQCGALPTVTCGFDVSGLNGEEQGFDEREPARKLSTLFETVHHEHVIHGATLAGVLDTLVWHLDDFQAGISYQNLVTAGVAKQHMGVIFSGVGGDELFAGYHWRYRLALDASLSAQQFEDAYYRQWVRLLDDEWKRKLFSKPMLAQVEQPDTKGLFQTALRSGQASTPLQKALAFDMNHFLPALLTVEDRLSMAHGLESRLPFLDNGLVDLCLAMPDALKLRVGDNGEVVAKYVLKKALTKRLPDWVLNAKKQGFTPPDASWYRQELASWIESRLFGEAFLSWGMIQPDCLRQIWQQHRSGQRNHRFLIWSVLCLQSWYRQFLDGDTLTVMP